MAEQALPASPGDLIFVRDGYGKMQTGTVRDVKPVGTGGYDHIVYYVIGKGLHAIGLPVQVPGVEVFVMQPPGPAGWDQEALAMVRAAEGDVTEAGVLAACEQAAEDLADRREKELRRAEEDLMCRLPDTDSGWYTGTDTLPSADNRQLRAWQGARQMYVLTGDDEHKRNMEELVTPETPPLASDVARTLAPPAPVKAGRPLFFPLVTAFAVLALICAVAWLLA